MQKRILALVLLSMILCAYSKDTVPDTTQVEPDTMGSSETQEGAEPVSYGGIVECPIHSIDYHSFDSAFIKYVGEDAFSAWIDAQTDKLGTKEEIEAWYQKGEDNAIR